MSTDPVPYFESPRVPKHAKTYLGDGLYACFLDGTIWLEAYNGQTVSERVALEDTTAQAFIRFAKQCFGEAILP